MTPSDPARFWKADPRRPAPPPATIAALRRWERARGVRLPEPIRSALRIQDGGRVRNAEVEILPLAEIVRLRDFIRKFGDWDGIPPAEAPDRGLIFLFGRDAFHGLYLLNFNAAGPAGPPSVYCEVVGTGKATHAGATVEEFLRAQTAADDEPCVPRPGDFTDSVVIARATLRLTEMYRDPAAREDHVLVRGDEALIHLKRLQHPEGEERTRTTLPLPLDPARTRVERHLGRCAPGPELGHALYLFAARPGGGTEDVAATDDDGRWKNATRTGPDHIRFESHSRRDLIALRERLFDPGGEGVGLPPDDD